LVVAPTQEPVIEAVIKPKKKEAVRELKNLPTVEDPVVPAQVSVIVKPVEKPIVLPKKQPIKINNIEEPVIVQPLK